MIAAFDTRRNVARHVAAWADELVSLYGSDADRVMTACLEHPAYSFAERYSFRCLRHEVRRRRYRGLAATGYTALIAPVDGVMTLVDWLRYRGSAVCRHGAKAAEDALRTPTSAG